MLNNEEHLLICLAEECAEVQHRITKILRFGLHEVQPGQPLDNEQRLIYELRDMFGVLELLHENGIPVMRGNWDMVLEKKAKVLKFMAYAQEQGTLQSLPTPVTAAETPLSGETPK